MKRTEHWDDPAWRRAYIAKREKHYARMKILFRIWLVCFALYLILVAFVLLAHLGLRWGG